MKVVSLKMNRIKRLMKVKIDPGLAAPGR